jgi:metal-dependent amidase/aminoacylase/carboxypeptidase family protein
MERYVVATRLKPGAASAAEEMLSAGPPFDPGEAGLSAHAAYISNDYVFLVFEGEAAHASSSSKAKRPTRQHFSSRRSM